MTTIQKNVALMFLGIVAISSGGAFAVMQNTQTPTVQPESSSVLGHIQFVLTGADGNVKAYRQTDNLVVTEGRNTITDLAFPIAAGGANGNSTDNKFSYIGIGTGSTPAAAGNIGEETLISTCKRGQDATVTSPGTGQAQVDVTFSGATCAGTITESVLSNSGTGAAANAGEILARQIFTGIAVGASDSLTVTWTITFT